MYWEYFGFKEPPFALTPNPAFLFLSTPHQEAFAHLLFAIESRAGFIELSGEVGTGKTTIIRTLLNQLEHETHRSALIFNPTLSPLGLSREINTEFGLPATSNDLQELHQALNAFLLEENRSGRTVVLVIDEAQNLSVEVLEQLRLISNLETDRSKLIQIVMVGQPELRALLARPELRQLDQRITVRYHLKPMGFADTCDYIRHRIRFAAGGSEPLSFSAGAVRKIFAFSGGLPRLVNVACDRALLLAYTSESREVTPAMAAASLSDLGRDLPRRPSPWGKAGAALALVALLAAAGWSFFSDGYPAGQGAWGLKKGTWSGPGKPDDLATRQPGNAGDRIAALPEAQAPAAAGASAPSAAPQQGNFSKDRALRALAAVPEEENLREALNALLKIWRVPGFDSEPLKGVNFAVLAKTRGMNATRVTGNLEALARLDAPALLQVSVPGGSRVVALTGLGPGTVQVAPALDGQATLSRAELGQVWNGTAYLFWKDFHGIAAGKKPADQAARLKSLQGLLQGAGVYRGALDGVAGSKLTEAVNAFQRREGLAEDGKAKGLTLMLLYRRAGGFFPPTLQRGGAGESSAAPRGKGGA
ncbi:ATPase AAA [Geomonas silvestris]|uniref:ATPase AAA n=1 Tax=Geomonas silvestris TaxID=2740184 RepID=A0A6V8MET7_9BACT|nr:AAA family ATPase [Geomonas silvestris]GFO58333.1 ATPase AAA [Geomonas silvestris]